MSFITIFIIISALALIWGAVLVLKKSAKKFNLSKEELAKISQRNNALEKEEQKDDY
jgi:uncharacterized protein YpmB